VTSETQAHVLLNRRNRFRPAALVNAERATEIRERAKAVHFGSNQVSKGSR
jgi:hypothetical protein